MKEITEDDIKTIELELTVARSEFEKTTFDSLDAKLKWIADFANTYIPKLEKRFMTQDELDSWVFLPDDVRVKFYLYFPEHGLNMANYFHQLFEEKEKLRQRQYSRRFSDAISLRHND